MKKYSLSKIIVFKRTDGLDISVCIYCFHFLFPWSRYQSEWKKFFHSKKKSLTIELWYFRDIILARDQVFFAQFLLIDIKHDTVFKCGKVSFCCLFLFFNGVNKSLRKTVGNLVSLILTLKKIVGKNIDHSG